MIRAFIEAILIAASLLAITMALSLIVGAV